MQFHKSIEMNPILNDCAVLCIVIAVHNISGKFTEMKAVFYKQPLKVAESV